MLEKEINGVVCFKKFVKMYDIWIIGREDGFVFFVVRIGFVNYFKNIEFGIKYKWGIIENIFVVVYVYMYLNIRFKKKFY